MELTEAQYERIAPCLPVQRGNACVSNLQVFDAILMSPSMIATGGITVAARALAYHLHPGIRCRMFEHCQMEQFIQLKLEAVLLDSTIVKVHPDGTGVKKMVHRPSVKSRGRWTTKIHLVAADARMAVTFSLSPGQAHDAPEGRKLLRRLGDRREKLSLLMDRIYEGNETRQLALRLRFESVVPPRRIRINSWVYGRKMYKRRNEVERLFRRLKGFRRILSRFEKLDVIFPRFIVFAALR